jgi:putative endonuclease
MFVYILSSKRNGTLYIGVTGDLVSRVYQHKTKADPDSFTSRYNVSRLMYFETFDDPVTAISREKQLKGWLRVKKIRLIESTNPEWIDLYPALTA